MSAPAASARERILDAASAAFYARGIRAVVVDAVIAEAGVAKATLYRHFPSNDDLVRAFLERRDGRWRAWLAQAVARIAPDPPGRPLAVFDALGEWFASDDFRGCAFLNAASEFEDPQNPVRQVVAEHRQWYYQLLRRAFEDAGHELPTNAARHFVMLRDGAMSAAYLDTPTTAIRTFTRGVDGLIRTIDTIP